MRKSPWLVRGDIDGFFGLFVDNLLQLLLIAALCPPICGFSPEFVTHTVLPGAAVSILVGNLFYAWQARRLMSATGRTDVTALPYGINTVSLIAFIFLVMGPVYRDTNDPMMAWKAGLFACFLSAAMEFVGAFVGDFLRKVTPRAAMLSALAGIAITFISMGFVFQIFAAPAIAIIPMFLILVFYASRVKLPLSLPGGLVAVVIGVIVAWILRLANGGGTFTAAPESVTLGLHLPVPVVGDVLWMLVHPTGWQFLSIIIPMGLFNVIGALQCLESAEAAGDRYPTRPSLLMNAAGSFAAAFLGSPFATTIYIGHPGWKAMGARSAYSTINGVVITILCLVGGVGLILKAIPLEATLGILLWIGLIIMAQAFQEVPKEHALAVALGIVPGLAAWALLLIETSLRAAGSSLYESLPKFGNALYINGVIALNQGFLITSMIFSALLVFVIERKFRVAAGWALVAALLSASGLIHAYTLTAGGVGNLFGFMAAPAFFWSYLGLAACLFVVSGLDRKR